jgi:uncharacterized protein YecT (DUF1311 family)
MQQQAVAVNQDTRPYEFATADKQLNDAYQKLLAKLAPTDQAKLKKAQRAWVAFRDLDCAWVDATEPLNCKIERTDSRTKELEEAMPR